MKQITSKALIVSLIVLTIVVSGCIGQTTTTQNNTTESTKINSVNVLDKTFIRGSDGKPITIRLVGEIKIQGNQTKDLSCKLVYSDQFLGDGITRKDSIGNNIITLTSPVLGKLDLKEWGLCCDLAPKITEKTQTTVCAK